MAALLSLPTLFVPARPKALAEALKPFAVYEGDALSRLNAYRAYRRRTHTCTRAHVHTCTHAHAHTAPHAHMQPVPRAHRILTHHTAPHTGAGHGLHAPRAHPAHLPS